MLLCLGIGYGLSVRAPSEILPSFKPTGRGKDRHRRVGFKVCRYLSRSKFNAKFSRRGLQGGRTTGGDALLAQKYAPMALLTGFPRVLAGGEFEPHGGTMTGSSPNAVWKKCRRKLTRQFISERFGWTQAPQEGAGKAEFGRAGAPDEGGFYSPGRLCKRNRPEKGEAW